MATTRSSAFALLAICITVFHRTATVSPSENCEATSFVSCLSLQLPPEIFYTDGSPSYSSVLESSIKNLRFVTPATPRPLAIVAATNASHVQVAVRCGALHGVRVRPRSGGHDYEGLSYRSLDAARPFAVVDLGKLRAVRIDTWQGTAWIDSGTTLGELYYAIARRSKRHGFPAGVGPTVGFGGHLCGGGFGMMLRKYGLAADHVLNAILVNANGELLDKPAMGDDLFWAIRGGGGESFGIVLSWQVKLVRVPETVTVFTIHRRRNQSATDLITKWQQVAPAMPRDLFLRVVIQNQEAQFESLFLGTCKNLTTTMAKNFPELGMTQQDCKEMAWIQSVLYFAFYGTGKRMELLLDRGTKPDRYFKAKSDYMQEPIPRNVWEKTWSWFLKDGAGLLILDPYGGKMRSVAPSATPFPHRQGNLYNLQYYGFWSENGTEATKKHMDWIRGLYSEMEPYVSKNPRGAYVNYRDLDLGTNEEDDNGVTSYNKAKVWGEMYFKGNFERLSAIKAKVDPDDFFRNEQSIPPLWSRKGMPRRILH